MEPLEKQDMELQNPGIQVLGRKGRGQGDDIGKEVELNPREKL